jgi:hypothetical protein
MQLSKYSPSIINIKENPHKVHNRRKENGTYFKLAKDGQSERAPTNTL